MLICIASRPHLHLLICTAIIAPPLPSLLRHRYFCCHAAATVLATQPLLPSLPRGRLCLPCRAATAALLPSLSRGRQPLSTRNAPSLPLPALLTRPPTQSSSAANTIATLLSTRCRCITAAANALYHCTAHRRRAAAHRPHAADALLPPPPRCRPTNAVRPPSCRRCHRHLRFNYC